MTIDELRKLSVNSKIVKADSRVSASKEVCLNKVRYETKEQAARAYNSYCRNMQRNRGRRVNKIKHEQLPYKCPYCNGWHLARI